MAFLVLLIAGAFALLLSGLVRPLRVVATATAGSLVRTAGHRAVHGATSAPRRTRAP